MGSTRRSFTDEYKKQTVEFVLDKQHSVAEVARNLGISETTIGNWVTKERARRDSDRADEPLDDTERGELLRLREQARADKTRIAHLEMQVEFAKKVATWFAKHQQ